MKVYFTCSTAELVQRRHTNFGIRNHLLEHGHLLTRDWLPETERRLVQGRTDINIHIKQIYRACIAAIKDADAVIVDDTVSNFSTGHQITLALQHKKPTLVLWQGHKHRQFQQMFIHGIESDLLQVSEYDEKNLFDVIDVFLERYLSAQEKNRFHLVLNSPERMYLDWVQFYKGKSRTRVIRQALHDIIATDAAYQDHLLQRSSGTHHI